MAYLKMPQDVATYSAACHADMLERQVAEMMALQSVFPEEGAVKQSPLEQATLEAAKQVLHVGVTARFQGQTPLSGSVRVPDAELEGQPVYLRFTLPQLYPQDAPNLQVDCSAARKHHERLSACVKQIAEESAGEEVLLLAVDALSQAVQSLQQDIAAEEPPSSGKAKATPEKCLVLGRKLIWFHHILSTAKRKAIMSWSAELEVGGFSKPGHPGVLVIEGVEDSLVEYVARLRALRWQAMDVRCEESEACVDLESTQNRRRFDARKVRELSPDGGMSELSKLCEAAGLQHMFLTALKL